MISLGKREPKWYNSVQSKNENGTLMNFENWGGVLIFLIFLDFYISGFWSIEMRLRLMVSKQKMELWEVKPLNRSGG
jgi:hypothetical protein